MWRAHPGDFADEISARLAHAPHQVGSESAPAGEDTTHSIIEL